MSSGRQASEAWEQRRRQTRTTSSLCCSHAITDESTHPTQLRLSRCTITTRAANASRQHGIVFCHESSVSYPPIAELWRRHRPPVPLYCLPTHILVGPCWRRRICPKDKGQGQAAWLPSSTRVAKCVRRARLIVAGRSEYLVHLRPLSTPGLLGPANSRLTLCAARRSVLTCFCLALPSRVCCNLFCLQAGS
jgi:hypothetical protein